MPRVSARKAARSARRDTRRGWIFVTVAALVSAVLVVLVVAVSRFMTQPEDLPPPPGVAAASAVPLANDVHEPRRRGDGSRSGALLATPAGADERPLRVAQSARARIALVIDDLGRDPKTVATLEELGVPLALAVLPFETRTAEVVRAVRATRHELLLHLPMAASGMANPGPGALRPGMTDEELRVAVTSALDAVPGATGVNNHMGSAVTADRRTMAVVLDVLAEHDLYFLDSRTSAESVGFSLARERGLPAAQRAVFLDSDSLEREVEVQFDRMLRVALTEGTAIAIGHPHPSTLRVLRERVPEAIANGFEFVPLPSLLQGSPVTND